MRRRDLHLEADRRPGRLLQRGVRLRADRRHDVAEHLAATFLPQFLTEFGGCLLDAADCGQGGLSRRPLRHG